MAAPSIIHIPPTSASTSVGNAEDLRLSILSSLRAPTGHKSLPTTILYDERGLELYDDITTLAGEHYYLFPAEEHILKHQAPDVINVMCARDALDDVWEGPKRTRGVLLELGSGSLRKTAHLISALSSKAASTTPEAKYAYYALDLAPISITHSLESLAPKVNGNVELKGLVTDYDSGLRWIRNGGLDETDGQENAVELNSHNDLEEPARGRAVRRTADGVLSPSATRHKAARNVALKPTVSAPTVLPEEGERIPNPQYPETPPQSKSPDSSRSPSHHPSSRVTQGSSHHDEEEDDDVAPSTTYSESVSLSTRFNASVDARSTASGKHSYRRPRDVAYEWEHASPPLHLLFLGSSLGNFDRVAGANFLRSLPLRPGSSDTLLLGLDGRNDKARVERAYNDPAGYTAKFIMNGLNVAAKSLGLDEDEVNFIDRFDYHGTYNEDVGRHEAYYRTKEAFTIHPTGSEPISFEQDELVNIEYSYKYSDSDAHAMFAESNLRPITRWQDPESLYSLWLLERPAFAFPRLVHPGVKEEALVDFRELIAPPSPPSTAVFTDEDSNINSLPGLDEESGSTAGMLAEGRGGAFGTPSFTEFQELWKLWDEITLGMIPTSMLLVKPIHLRHICLFYLGHIPAFLDIHLSKLLNEPHSEPEHFKDIFERGIDPSVDDPTKIHPHSEVPQNPEDWPSLEAILGFRDRVRARVARLYDAIERKDEKVLKLGRKVDRVLWMCYEHEGWHAETLLYMLIQRAGTPGGTIAPKGFAPPPWLTSSSASSSDETIAPFILPDPSTISQRPSISDLITLADQVFTIGHDDFETEDPEMSVGQANPSHEYEFGWDNEHPRRQVAIPKPVMVEKLCITNVEYLVYFRLFKEEKGLQMPESWVPSDESDGSGVEFKVRSLYGPVPFSVAAQWPLVASYDEIASFAAWKGGRIMNEVELRAFMDRHLGAESTPVGFKEWSFIPGLAPRPEEDIRGHNGGVWEWSSSALDHHRWIYAIGHLPGVFE